MISKFRMIGRRLSRLWSKAGFYVLSMLCVAAFSMTAYAVRQRLAGASPAVPTPAPETVLSAMDETLSAKQETPLIWPVAGRSVLRPHSPNDLTWWETLNAYRTHEGLDIAAVRGEAVAAAMDGRITAAFADPLLGYTIEITHEDNILTRYANLSTLHLVTIGEQVKAGQVISSVGSSADAESDMAPHLHFEAWQGDVWLDLPEA